MRRITGVFVLAATAALSGCVVVPAPYASAAPYGVETIPAEVYPAYVQPWSFGLYVGRPYGYYAPGYRYGYGPGPRGGPYGGWAPHGYRVR